MNLVTLSGRITKDLQLSYTKRHPVLPFRLGSRQRTIKRKKQEAEAKGQATADF